MQIRGILNKITPSTFDSLANDFCAVKVYEDATLLPKIIDLIFEKAVEEPHFCPLYADLCVRQVNKEREETKSKSRFGNALIQKCQDTFQSDKKANDEVEQQKVGTDTKEGIQQEKQSTSEEEWAKEKRRLHGIIQLV
jgi:translation initiation factor 4G